LTGIQVKVPQQSQDSSGNWQINALCRMASALPEALAQIFLHSKSKGGSTMRRRDRKFFDALALALAAFLLATPGLTQPGYQFGQNKVQYKNFDWSVLRTEHFDVHYYKEEAEAAADAARMAERGYAYLSEVMEHQFKNRIPLVLYASLNDFQQTNVVDGLIGDGTRGVTESMKGRVVLPITGSYREFNHVLVHELVHAFQFDIMSSGKGRVLGGFNPPLWFMEGMAEYLSVGMDNITRMWVRDALLNNKLLSVQKLGSTFDIRVYRLGESLWNYIGETYGKKKAGQILKTAVNMGDIERAFKAQIDMDFKRLTVAWHAGMRAQTLPADSTLQRPDQIAQQITTQESYFHRINLVPSVSPDGRQIAYVANKNLTEEIYLLSQKEDGTYENRRLIKGGQSSDFESLRFFDTSISWSRDGSRIAFVSKAGKDDAIYVMNPKDDEIQHKLVFDHLNGLVSPSFSPGGNQLVFAGIEGGRSDLFIGDLPGGELKRLTHDRFAELQPQWSPDGGSIVFATDRGRSTDENNLLFGDYDLAVYSLATKSIELITDVDGNAINPQWSPDGREVTFVSDHQGIANIYRVNLTNKEISPITALRIGVAGITESTPAMSLSADGRVMVFSSFVKEGWQLFRMELPGMNLTHAANGHPDGTVSNGPAEDAFVAVAKPRPDSLWLPAIADPNNFYASYALTPEDSVKSRTYGSTPKLAGISLGASVGGYYGTVGGAQVLFSDMLGNHNLILSADISSRIKYTDLGVAYVNQGRRLNYGLQAFQLSNAYGAFLTPTAAGFIEQTYRGVNAFAYYPFSRFSRLEVSAGAIFVGQDLITERVEGGRLIEEKQDGPSARFGQFGAALVYDNTVYGPMGPMTGQRSRFEVQRATNDFQFTTMIGDYRRYFNVSPRSVLAWRVVGASSLGRDKQVFRIGVPETFRGSEFGDILGTNILIQNLEFRFPLLPFLPANADFLSGVTFVDAAAGWGLNVPGLIKEEFKPFSTDGGFHLQDLRSAFGLGARLSLGYVALKFDVAWPTDLQNVGKPIRMFSIGADF
jgi:Tol biopolymer transport system component